ncbi:MAG: DUF3568 family protein [Planctomycetota bacterium]|nr:MAG: DUF3568 family protein [Planctomycetota bacterium]
MAERNVRMLRAKVFLILLLAGTAVTAQSCATIKAGAAGTMAYVRGELRTVEPRDISVVYAATGKAIKELELSVTEKTKDAMSAKVVARDSEYKKITIKLSATAEDTTKLSIRVGMFGDERKSRLIYGRIKEHLD